MKIKTYKELEYYLGMFKRQNNDLLIIKSKAGLGKTTILKEVMQTEDYVYVNTHSTPLQTYKTLYEKRDCPVCFDDMDSLFSSNILVSLFKSLSDTSPIKELHYNSTSRLMEDVPNKFTTTSNACVLLNEFDVRNKSLEPIIDRGFYIEFEPSNEEILKKIKEIAKSQSIGDEEKCVLKFIEKNYQRINNLSLRTYQKALQLFLDDRKNWEQRFMRMVGFDEKAIQYLFLKSEYKSDKERVKRFKWSRAVYFRIKKDVEGY